MFLVHCAISISCLIMWGLLLTCATSIEFFIFGRYLGFSAVRIALLYKWFLVQSRFIIQKILTPIAVFLHQIGFDNRVPFILREQNMFFQRSYDPALPESEWEQDIWELVSAQWGVGTLTFSFPGCMLYILYPCVWHDIWCDINHPKHFQKISQNVDLRLVFGGIGGDWSHDSGRSCRHPSGSTLYIFGSAKM